MPHGEVPPRVRQFIVSTINSVDQLEVLLFLMSNAERAWTSGEISSRTRLTEGSVAEKLEGLVQAQLATVGDDGTHSYRYDPSSPALAQEVADSLQRAYLDRKDTVISLIYSRPLDNIRVFSDAFKIRGDD